VCVCVCVCVCLCVGFYWLGALHQLVSVCRMFLVSFGALCVLNVVFGLVWLTNKDAHRVCHFFSLTRTHTHPINDFHDSTH